MITDREKVHASDRADTRLPPELEGVVSGEDLVAFADAHCLTERERDVLLFTLQNRLRRQMARLMGIKPHTVDTYCDHLHKKLGVKDHGQIMLMVLRFAAERRKK